MGDNAPSIQQRQEKLCALAYTSWTILVDEMKFISLLWKTPKSSAFTAEYAEEFFAFLCASAVHAFDSILSRIGQAQVSSSGFFKSMRDIHADAAIADETTGVIEHGFATDLEILCVAILF
jgi:hypothetical protein